MISSSQLQLPLPLPLILFLLFVVVAPVNNSLQVVTAVAVQNEPEPVCPSDYLVLISSIDNDNGNGEEEDMAKRRRRLVASTIQQPVKVVRQGESYVEFTIQNTTWFHSQGEEEEGPLSDHLFTTMETGLFGSQHCIMDEGLEMPLSTSTDVMKAHCDNDSSSSSSMAIIRTYSRYKYSSTTPTSTPPSTIGSVVVEIPKCCHDPYANTATATDNEDYYVIEYVFKVMCTPTCDDPDDYIDDQLTDPPTTSPTPPPQKLPRKLLQEEIIKDMMPQSSSRCNGNNNSINTTFTYESSQADSKWNTEFVKYEEDLFLAKMSHIDNNSNRSWTIRLGQAGNIYSFVGPMGETVPPQDHNDAPWVDEVWQAVQPLGPNGDNDNDSTTGPYFIHEAGTYQRDGEYTAKPFYSPSTGRYCNDNEGECGFATWGQQAHVATPWKSPMLYFNRYVNCGDGVFEYTTLRHNNVGSEESFGYLNVPWGGTRTSVLGDVVITNKITQKENVVYPLVSWSDGVSTPLKDTMGYTVFAEDLPKNANPLHDTPYPIPDGLELTIGSSECKCEGQCNTASRRYVCTLVSQPQNIGWAPNRGDPGQIVRLEGQDSGKSVVVGVRHWAGNGKLYFYQSDVLTLAKIHEALTPNTKVNVFYYLPPESGKPLEDNLALGHVHGGENGSGNYPRVRYGAAGRDFNVYTINDVPTIPGGSTYYYRQYFMMDAYTEMKSKGPQWAPEAVKATKGVGMIDGRTVQLFQSVVDSSSSTTATATFGHTIQGDTCRVPGGVTEVTPTCEGTTTPEANSKALFQIRCGDSYAVTENMYYFSPLGPPYRSYVCDGMEDIRPEWTLLGYFPVDSCTAIGSGYQYDAEYC
mmetsp:Transcript_40172/g.46209  ORF Transcript_40172/g.46209 Transcript_40172/m.46209 type:complete len:860 (+) Transcript_40172:168-2747(+)